MTLEKDKHRPAEFSAPSIQKTSHKKICIRESAEETPPETLILNQTESPLASPIFVHIWDLQSVLSSILLPPNWFAQDLTHRQNLVIFACVDDYGRLLRSVSYSLLLNPRITICNERVLEEEMDLVKDKCKVEIEQRLKEVNELKICADTKTMPPARAAGQRKACEIIVPQKSNYSVCRTCSNFRKSLQQKDRRNSKQDTNFLRAKEYLDELCSK